MTYFIEHLDLFGISQDDEQGSRTKYGLIPKMTKIHNLKRRYSDLRWGYSQVGFLIGMVNFLILFYNFTGIKTMLNFWVFAVLSFGLFLIAFMLVGKVFRQKQMSTDANLSFEQQPLYAKTYRMLLEQGVQTDEVKKHVVFLKRIENNQL